MRERFKLSNRSGQALGPGEDEARQHHILVRPGTGQVGTQVGTGGIGQYPDGIQPCRHRDGCAGPADDTEASRSIRGHGQDM